MGLAGGQWHRRPSTVNGSSSVSDLLELNRNKCITSDLRFCVCMCCVCSSCQTRWIYPNDVVARYSIASGQRASLWQMLLLFLSEKWRPSGDHSMITRYIYSPVDFNWDASKHKRQLSTRTARFYVLKLHLRSICPRDCTYNAHAPVAENDVHYICIREN